MKNYKFIFLTILLAVFTLSSCSDETSEEPEQNTESASAKKAMTGLKAHYNNDGSLNSANNPTGNILFDYGFTYEFPISLTYNSDATKTVNNHSELVDAVIAMTDNLYISNVDYPFTINKFDQDTNATVQSTISNEDNFDEVVTAARFNNDCECDDSDEPVCVVYSSPSGGEEVTLTYPNACEAICSGFVSEDFVSCEEEDFCWDFDYPVSITYNGDTREVSDSEEMGTLLAPAIGATYDVIYPFDVSIGGIASTITTPNNFSDIGEWADRCQ